MPNRIEEDLIEEEEEEEVPPKSKEDQQVIKSFLHQFRKESRIFFLKHQFNEK